MRLPDLPRLLKDLVALQSVNPTFGGAGEAAVASFVADFFEKSGIRSQRQEVLPGGRDNILCVVGDDGAPAILLEAHMDTVAVDGWFSGSPFDPVEKEGRLYGPGACDTKASLAVFMAVAAYFAEAPDRLRAPLAFAATVDEEDNQMGAFRLMEAGLNLKGAITGEPTQLDIVNAHKGVLRIAVETSGIAAHGAFPERGDNAILRMGRVLSLIAEYIEELSRRPSHPSLGGPTLSIGTISGGRAVNVVPDSCRIELDRRLLPDETGDEATAEVRRLVEGLGRVSVKVFREARSGIDTSKEDPLSKGLAEAARGINGRCAFLGAPYMTNATAYAAAGLPSLVFGPGDIAQAHTRDEYVELAQLESAFRILVRFLSK